MKQSDFKIVATRGRLFDLEKGKSGISSDAKSLLPWGAIDIERVNYLKSLMDKSDNVIIATDNDIEGEVIARHVQHLVGKESFRLIYNEITEAAIRDSLDNLTDVSLEKSNVGISRRILDRLIGYEASDLEYGKSDFSGPVGRVITPVINDFLKDKFSPISIKADYGDIVLDIDLPNNLSETEVITNIKMFDLPETVDLSEFNEGPHIWDYADALTELSENMSISPSDVALLLQELYQQGRVSYPRTDSTTLNHEQASAFEKLSLKFGIDDVSKAKLLLAENPNPIKNIQESHTPLIPLELDKIDIKADVKNEITNKSDAIVHYLAKNIISVGQEKNFEKAFKCEILDSPFKKYLDYNDLKYSVKKLNKKKKPLKVEVKTNNLEVEIIKRMKKLGVARPSTYPIHAKSINDRFFSNGDLNKRAISSLKVAEKNIPSLLDNKVVSGLETFLLSPNKDTVLNILDGATNMLGVPLEIAVQGDFNVIKGGDLSVIRASTEIPKSSSSSSSSGTKNKGDSKAANISFTP